VKFFSRLDQQACYRQPVQPLIPAIPNALYAAIEVRFTELPVNPEKFWRHWVGKKKKYYCAEYGLSVERGR
jgi:hypothetical protein